VRLIGLGAALYRNAVDKTEAPALCVAECLHLSGGMAKIVPRD
jgi:hypothetical protein